MHGACTQVLKKFKHRLKSKKIEFIEQFNVRSTALVHGITLRCIRHYPDTSIYRIIYRNDSVSILLERLVRHLAG